MGGFSNNPNTYDSKVASLLKKHSSPLKEHGPWFPVTNMMLNSDALSSLTGNATKALLRLIAEHLAHAGRENGRLKCTHADFIKYGIGRDRIADALAELSAKGLIKIIQGDGGAGYKHANIFTLTFAPSFEGTKPTHDWEDITLDDCDKWKTEKRAKAFQKRSQDLASKKAKASRRRKEKLDSPLRNIGIKPVRKNGVSKEVIPKIRTDTEQFINTKISTPLYNMGESEAQASCPPKGQAQSSDVRGNEIDLQKKKNAIIDIISAGSGFCGIWKNASRDFFENLKELHLTKQFTDDQLRAFIIAQGMRSSPNTITEAI